MQVLFRRRAVMGMAVTGLAMVAEGIMDTRLMVRILVTCPVQVFPFLLAGTLIITEPEPSTGHMAVITA